MIPKTPPPIISLSSNSLSTSSKTMNGGSRRSTASTTNAAVSEPEFLLKQAEKSLRLRDFSVCRSFALQALNRNPKFTGAEQILAVADVLIAAQTTAVCNPNDMKKPNPNYYTILQLPSRTDDATLIRNQFKKLILLVNPIMHGSTFANEAYWLIDKAYVQLDDQIKKARFDSELSECHLNKHRHYHQLGEDGDEVNRTFWTACPYCYCVFEYARVYEDCCLRCQKCRKAFHGVAIPSPPPVLVVDGKDEYLCCLESYPLGFIREADCRVGERNKGSNGCHSDDLLLRDLDLNKLGEGEKERKSGGDGDIVKEEIKRKEGPNVAESKPKGRRKTVAKSVKKITGTGNRVKRVIGGMKNEEGEGGGMGFGIDYEGGMTSGDGRGFVMDGIQYFPGDDDDELFVGLEVIDV